MTLILQRFGGCEAVKRDNTPCTFLASVERGGRNVCPTHAVCYDEWVQMAGDAAARRRVFEGRQAASRESVTRMLARAGFAEMVV